jgi:hypothetical protein
MKDIKRHHEAISDYLSELGLDQNEISDETAAPSSLVELCLVPGVDDPAVQVER